MSQDATFEDGGESPLRLMAEDAKDLEVISALVQDAVFPASEMSWRKSERRFALLLNRFRWEDRDRAEARGRPVERVQTMLVIDDALAVRSAGVVRGDADTILSLLSLSFAPAEDGAGTLELTLAGDGAIALSVECINVTLQDVTRPYLAPSRKSPSHP
ncbi:DUF2948 family protein [Dinoroseobacter sp. S375]|uniref:DUF2948 family protein n=1 Tax=Dinoroseobacter sp. S375 TaxID=3415136 RepID=UPI003C7C0BE4